MNFVAEISQSLSLLGRKIKQNKQLYFVVFCKNFSIVITVSSLLVGFWFSLTNKRPPELKTLVWEIALVAAIFVCGAFLACRFEGFEKKLLKKKTISK